MQTLARRPVVAVAGAFTVVLLAVSARYGYHRDELYFLMIGRHPAFGYVDEPPLVPLLAHAVDAVSGHSLFWLRVPAAVAGGLVVLTTGLITREFGGGRGAQVLSATLMAISSATLAVSHLASTSVYDQLGETLLTWLLVRALRDGGRVWLIVGLVAGVALEVKTLPVFLLFAVLVGVLAVGPRGQLRSPWLYAGGLIALALWTPDLVWEAQHHWPQLTLSKAIADGQSGSSQPRAVFLPFQALMTGPPLVPAWVAGLVALWRSPALRPWRGFTIAWAVLVVLFIATGGKPYYLASTYPVLYAAGAAPTLRWIGTVRWRRVLVAVTFTISLLVSATITLLLVPVSVLHSTPVLASAGRRRR